ncbi:DUF4157 domain-containing protein [Mangrovivirga sp. M17]|uniref:DUF4157 domain-containing protein n=1 Tax=Mangrovivirga halotolerans TaxID=2993936 RepID=A0ABT3RQI8_9BACT|nr:DUF4157 domain-containing protein [Mangrovivirga halotolerans]MCX2743880.1 DUF4157 domain-containing protein [Mangrovivirga halotolerans]
MKTKVSPAISPNSSTTKKSRANHSPYFQKKVQSKLKSGKKDDKYEKEADKMADNVVASKPFNEEIDSTQETIQKKGLFSQITKGVQLKGIEEIQNKQEKQELQKKEDEAIQAQNEEEIQSKKEEEELQKSIDLENEENENIQLKQHDEIQKSEDLFQKKKEEENKESKDYKLQQKQDNDLQLEQEEAIQEKEEDLQEKSDEDKIQAKRSEKQSINDGAIEAKLKEQKSKGKGLPEPIKAKMEKEFRADFSGIRIHTDDTAILLSKMLKAKAFTYGKDIFFNKNNFNPDIKEGEHLLAHELTHTIQQRVVEEKKEQVIQLQEDDNGYYVRPEILKAISIARSQIGKINSKLINADKTRIGWEKLYEIFFTAFGNKEVIPKQVIKYITMTMVDGKKKDALPSWCGIFVWWSLKKAGVPLPDWKLGQNILQHTIPRKPGELPRKGDIAFDFQPNQHFAMVTGVEDPESAKGKDYNSIMVATINGNTAGSDNLGGQVEEKWEPIGKWRQDAQSGFMDPIGKLNMPDVPLVKTQVTPDEISEPEEKEGGEDKPIDEEEVTELPAGESEDIISPEETPSEEDTSIEVQLPAPPSVDETEEIAKIEKLDISGSSDEAMVKYTEAKPSQMADNFNTLGPKLEEKANSEKKELADNPPKLELKTSGKVEEGITPPDQLGIPSESDITDGTTGADPGNLEATPHENKGPAPSNEENKKLLDKNDNDGFLAWLRNNIKSFMSRIKTTDDGVNTSAGDRPSVELKGESDPERLRNQRDDAQGKVVTQRDTVTDKLKNHPGQKNIQPKEVNEEKTAKINSEPTANIKTENKDNLKDFAEAQLPKNVRDKTDEMMQPGLQANLNEAKTKTQQAANKRDTEKKGEIDTAKSKAKKISEDADNEQRNIVIENRGKVASKQKEGIQGAYDHVNSFNIEADTEQVKSNKEITEKVKTSEEDAKKELKSGEDKAEKKKKEKEKEAAAKKRELEKEQESDSWWDRVKSAIKKAVKAITDAIDSIFKALRKAVAEIIEAAKKLAVDLINKARKWVIDKLNKFRDWAKNQVNKYLKEHFPGLAKKINEGIDGFVDTAIDGVNYVADKAIEGVEALADGLAAALDKILATFQEGLKAAVQIAGAVLTGDFAEALKIAIKAACNIAGIDPGPIFDLLDKAKKLLTDILKNPLKFFNNLMAAIGGGVRNFFSNIKQHLIKGLIGWLTGALAETPIKLPETFDVIGIFKLVLQILGLTYENIKARIIKKFPPAEKVFYVVEEGLSIIKRVITEGPQVLWEIVKEKLSNLKEMVMGAIRDYVIKTVVYEGITWLLGLLNPAGALVKILKLAYDLIMWLVDKFQQIVDFVKSVYNSVAAIASGQIEAASKKVEEAMSKSLPVLISLLASMAGLGGIGQTIQKLIKKVTAPINKIIDKLIDKGIALVKKFLKKGKDAVKGAKDKLVNWWKAKKNFKAADGEKHKLYLKGKGKSAKLMVASENPGPYESFLKEIDPGDDKKKEKALKKAKPIAAKIDTEKNKPLGGKDKKEKKKLSKQKEKRIKELLTQLSVPTAVLFGSDLPESDVKHTPGTYGGSSMGKSMEAKILTKKLPKQGTKGSSPTQAAHTLYDKLNLRRLGKGAFYVRGHLLNDNIHGPGIWKNMTPLSVKGNKNHLQDVETKVKTAVSSGAIVRYNVTPNYNRASSAPSDEKLKGTNIEPIDWPKVKTIKEAEKYVPTTLSCEAYLLEEKGGSYKDKKNLVTTNVDNPVDQALSSYQLDETQIERVNLSTDSSQHIAKNTGISVLQAGEIKNAINALTAKKEAINFYNQLKKENKKVSDQTISELTKRSNVVLK